MIIHALRENRNNLYSIMPASHLALLSTISRPITSRPQKDLAYLTGSKSFCDAHFGR